MLRKCDFKAIYEMETLRDDMSHISTSTMQDLWESLSQKEDNDVRRSAFSFLSEYSNMDVFSVRLEWESLKEWTISSPAKQRLIKHLHTPKAKPISSSSLVSRGVGTAVHLM